jgi:hypothetical protein
LPKGLFYWRLHEKPLVLLAENSDKGEKRYVVFDENVNFHLSK